MSYQRSAYAIPGMMPGTEPRFELRNTYDRKEVVDIVVATLPLGDPTPTPTWSVAIQGQVEKIVDDNAITLEWADGDTEQELTLHVELEYWPLGTHLFVVRVDGELYRYYVTAEGAAP